MGIGSPFAKASLVSRRSPAGSAPRRRKASLCSPARSRGRPPTTRWGIPRSSERRTCWVSWSCMARKLRIRRAPARPPGLVRASGSPGRRPGWLRLAGAQNGLGAFSPEGPFEPRHCPVKVRRPMMRAAAFLLAVSVLSCKRSEDQAAKQRIFSPEEPVGALAEAKEPLDAGRLADDPRLAERVVRMGQAEVAARLGAHKGQTRVQPDGGRGPDPDTSRRMEVWQKEEPTRVAGTLVVDAQTAAPLAADLQGHFRVPGEGGPAAELDLHSVLTVSGVGKDPGVQPPQFESEPSVPHAVKDPLRFLGKAPAAPGAASTEDPAADETDEEAPEQTADQPARQR